MTADELPPVPRWWHCDTHGPGNHTAWGCPECVREMREEINQLKRWKSTNAPRLEALQGLLHHEQAEAHKGREAIATLASERAANALLTDEVERLRAALYAVRAQERERWESALGAVMPADFKDWHGSPEDRPETAAAVIRSLQEREQMAWGQVAAAQAQERERCMGAMDSHGRYWVENRGRIIDAVTAAGFRIMSDRDRCWLEAIRAQDQG
jgi:hypothetical protein